MPNEPSMEEILSSIKRIIAEDDAEKPASRPVRRAAKNGAQLRAVATPPADEQILELTNALPGDSLEEADMRELAMSTPAGPTASDSPHRESNDDSKSSQKPKGKSDSSATTPTPNAKAQAEVTATPSPVLSDLSAQAARESLTHLSRLLIRPEDGQSNTLEGLVREMLRPMLKEWLDANLPDMVETLVKREIDRITGRV